MNKFSKWLILISSIVIVLFLALEAWRENLSMDWQKYQHKYKEELSHKANSEQDRALAEDYEIKLRQIVVPELNRYDRCITCHAAIEDSRMKEMPNPLKSHPGDYLDTHDMNKVGCTACHDGQGRAVNFEDAHAKGIEKFWEKPLLKKPFIESTCIRCHADVLVQTPTYNLGKQLFQDKACFACHSIGDIGGVKGPALSDIGNASFHVKMPTPENRHDLLEKFDQNVNLAYLYESITDPEAQPEETLMKKLDMSEAEVEALMVYLKSLSSERRAMDVGVSRAQTSGAATVAVVKSVSATSGKVTGGSSKGYLVFSKTCVACHTIGKGDGVGPDLKGVAARRDPEWMKKMIQTPSKMIEAKDPIVMELMKKFPTPMVDMGLTDEQVKDVMIYLAHPEDVSISAGASGEKPSEESVKKSATQAEISKGSALFQGKQRFLNKGPSCIACHHVRGSGLFGGGALAKELTDAHSRLGGIALPALLQNPPFPVMREAYKNKPLEADEVTAVVAFLEKVSEEEGNQFSEKYQSKMFLVGAGGLAFLLGCYGVFWMYRRKKSVNKDLFDRQKDSEKES